MHAAVAQSLLVRRRTLVLPFVVLSIGAHALVVVAAVVIGMFHRPPAINLDQKPIKASLVRLGKPRDKKLLPRKEELPPPPQEVKATAPPPPKPVEPPPKAVEQVPIPGLKPPSPAPAKQEGVKEAPPKKSLASAFGKFAAKAPEELEGAEDGDVNGDSAIQEGERYYGALKAAIRRYYDVASTISEQERMYLRAEVLVRIGTRGELLEARVSKSSGNDLFDSAVESAAKKAAPFGPPPDHLRPELGRGIILEFTP